MTTRRKFLTTAGVGAVGAVATGLSTPVRADAKIKWRMQTYAGSALAEHVIKPAIESFNKIAGEEMQIELFFADQLVPTSELFRAMQNGTIDAVQSDDDSMASPTEVTVFGGYFPFASRYSLDVPVLFNQYGLKQIWEEEYAKVGVKHISAGAWDPCHFATKEPIHSLADLQGKRVFTFPTAGRFLTQFGVVPVTLPWEDIEVAVQTGELDGVAWSGHSARHAIKAVYDIIQNNRTVLVFVNTRSQAEFVFQELWRANEEGLAIALHHGSLSPEQRRKVEAAMVAGTLRAIVCTSTLDLGIDWGDVDLVINLGAPKGASRLLQRIGRANHRLDDPSRALLVPANRFEVLECEAARHAALMGEHDGMAEKKGSLDVLAQHVFGVACSGPFDPSSLYDEVVSASPYAHLGRAQFDQVVDFVSHALQTYDRYRRLRPVTSGEDTKQLRLAHPRLAQQYRMNVGTIVEAPMLTVRLVRRRPANGAALGRMGRVLGQIEEYFIEQLVAGDTFLFAGKVLRFEGLVETEAIVTQTKDDNPAIPAYYGGKFPLSTYLASRVRHMLATPEDWYRLPAQVSEWLRLQQWRSTLPKERGLLVETFPRGDRFYMVCYPFEGRLAHQTLGMLLTRRLDRAGARPMGFIASEYALAIWGLRDPGWMVENKKLSLETLFSEDMLGDDLESWLAESNLMKRTFRNCAVISGLIERRFPGKEKTGRQVTFSSDLIYNVLREHEPDHILLQATHDDAANGLLDVGRVAEMLSRIKSRIELKRLDRVSPLAVPVLLDIGKEAIHGDACRRI